MTSRLGVYWSVMHRRAQDYEYFKGLQPSVFKIMDGGEPDYAFARDNLPGSLVIARDWALSEQHTDMLNEPDITGERHAREWNQHADRLGFDRAKTLILGINEPKVWEPGVPEALRVYTIALCDEATRLGLRVGAMQLSVGWPNNKGPDTPPDWSPWHGVEDAIKRGDHALICHEYWADKGPKENWGWWGGRALKCPWQVPIIIGETGIEMFVKYPNKEQNERGWRKNVTPERYAGELAEYTALMSADPRFVGCAVFASDFADDDWWSFDIEPAYQAIFATPVSATTPPITTHLPVIGAGPMPTGPTAVSATPAGARIRQYPGVTSPILGAVPFGTALQVTGINPAGTWYQVDSPFGQGWVSGTVVAVSGVEGVPVVESGVPPAPTPPAPPVPAQGGIIDPRVAQAILQIESGGRTHGINGLPIIRFEAHVFKQMLGNDALWAQHFRVDPATPWARQEWRSHKDKPWMDMHPGDQGTEWAAYEFARSINPEAAAKSISMGAGQIMGFHHARIGYPSAQAMLQAFNSGPMQTIGFINFFLSDPALFEAVRNKDWRTIAKLYNGAGAVDTYAPLLQKAYEAT